MSLNERISYTIVVCVSNREEKVFKRCLDAISALDISGITTEVLLVDSSSMAPLVNLPFVRDFLRKTPTAKIIVVAAQGIKNSRLGAIKEATGKYIVFFDSDNEPEKDYLQQLKKTNEKFPKVGAVGAGEVNTDFIDGIENDIEEYAREIFQERHENAIRFSGRHQWQSCYPYGSGLCIYTSLLKDFMSLTREGKFTMSTARDANAVAAGDETQMVLHCIDKGYAAGITPALRITHIIPRERVQREYLQKLIYGTGLYYESCLSQAFPEHKEKLRQKILPGTMFFLQAIRKYCTARFSSDPRKIFELVDYIGLNAGAYLALNKPVPPSIKMFVKYLKLE
ncbi:MAG: glycosyltransferase [Ginsengibacter sp.]